MRYFSSHTIFFYFLGLSVLYYLHGNLLPVL